MKTSIAALRATLVVLVSAAVVACDGPTTPQTIAGDEATLHSSQNANTCPGNSGGDCDMSATVLMKASGGAILVVRTGGYDQATGIQTPNGTFDKVQWKIYDAKGKLTSTKNSDADGTVFITSLSGTFTVNHRVEVQANISGHSGKKGTAVVRKTAAPVYAPDIDLTAESIDLLVDGTRQPLTAVLPGVSNTYVVDFENLNTLGGTPSTTGIRTLCVVTVDGRLQVPHFTPGFSYVGSPFEYLAPGETAQCTFKLTLSEGSHTVKVTAVAADLFLDCNVNNNSTTATVATGTPADLSVSRFERLVTGGSPVSAPAFGEVTTGTAHTFVAAVSSPASSRAADATCSIVVTPAVTPAEIVWNTQAVHVNGGATQECRFTLTPATAGTYTIVVTATSTGDPVASNNTSTGTLVVNPPVNPTMTANLVVKAIPLAPTVIDGGIDVVYTAAIGVLPGGTRDNAAYSCVATATRVSDNAAATVTPMTMTGSATTTTDGTCVFRVGGMSAATQDQAYRITVTVTPTDANEFLADDNTLTVSQPVQPKTIDLTVRTIEREDGAEYFPLGQVTAGIPATYVARIRATGAGNQASATPTCTATATNLRTGAVVNGAGLTVAGTATAATDATCRFSLNLESNGDIDEDYRIDVTTTPVGANDLNPSNNALSGAQKAIVRVDLSASGVEMIVGSDDPTGPATISMGKVGNYIVTFHNGSSRPATFNCVVTAQLVDGLPVPLPLTTANPVTIEAGEDAICRFDYAFPTLMAVRFVASAAGVSPLDGDLANNAIPFETVSHSDHTFPAIGMANVHALQTWLTNPLTGGVAALMEQSTSVTRITLTFAAVSANLGDFKLVGAITSNGRPISNATWTVNDLAPGLNGAANCVSGVDPGATAVNNHTLNLRICAQEVAGDANTQAIFIEYASAMVGEINNSSAVLFGSEVSFDVKLHWTLNGSSYSGPGYEDSASALLSFAMAETATGVPNLHQSEKTGQVTVVRNGG